ncbi:four-carbon acid sugar kinase family protein [Halobacillus salinarum]|uniref:Four-carbon acid sugar kinase family protein n=1 Tax=Halobacillus salinarum TaxID=2932257 RepID=A0ABY4EKH9_9BACI|nr:four-carbon acid sugar kinase family protein [Halobacillus salinarum]UOQ44978.1 four-carbon acid sugar kinase family protein [Halobacillus salinarum]
MSYRFGMIADDLTGANDSGVQLKEKGLATSVFFELPDSRMELGESIVIDTDSRALDLQEAMEATKSAARFLIEKGYPHIYKKMDSTLRGYVGEELESIREVYAPEFVVVAPAFPPYGRTTKDGVHYLHGQPVSGTELAYDPKHPVKEAHLPSLIEASTGKQTALLTADVLHKSEDDWMYYINQLKDRETPYLICDAESMEDLRKIAERISRISNKVIWAGSAGLAEVLPEVLGIETQENNHLEEVVPGGPVLTVCGSLSQTTQEQVLYAAEQTGVHPVIVDTEQMLKDSWNEYAEVYCRAAVEAFQAGRDVVLYVPSTLEIREKVARLAEEKQLNTLQIGKRISHELGKLTDRILTSYPALSSLVLTGGDTAKDVARSLGAKGIQLYRQLEAGIPLGELLGSKRKVHVVTKAGAFGTDASIYRAMINLKGENQDEQQTNHRYHYG